jgi:hypothetical protein
MRNSSWIALAIITMSSGAHTRAGSRLPENLEMPAYLANAVTHVYEQSETFRAQCDRLAQAQNVRVRVRFDFNMRCQCRAFTIINRERGSLSAEIHVAPGGMLPELIAHEFEHILEQMEHLDLRALARVPGSGVYEVESDRFETVRARQAGRIVLAETRGSMAAIVPAPAVSLTP